MPKIALAGFGMEGRAAYKYLKGSAEIEVFDETQIDGVLDVPFHLGLNIPADFDLVYKTPGIPTSHLVLESDRTRVTTLMDDVLQKVGTRAVGVTGTKGKSTVTALIHHVLRGAGRRAELFGNIGIADMSLVDSAPPDTLFIIEMSSYQLEYVTHSPHIAVMTSFFPEHLSHHGSLEAYRDAKLNIARFQTRKDVFVNGSGLDAAFAGRVVLPKDMRCATKLLGEHNQRNCALAFAALRELSVPEEVITKHIATFEPLPFRIERIGEHRGLTFYDDSLATIPEATLATIDALPRVDTLILGGEDRGIPFEKAAEEFAKRSVSTYVIFPDTGAKMTVRVVGKTVVSVSTMEDAVRAAYEHTKPGGVVLLSNASPSFNLFRNYKDKSAQYRDWVQKLA